MEKLIYMRRMMESGLCLVISAMSESNQNDPAFVKAKSSMMLVFLQMSSKAETFDKFAHIVKRVNIFVNGIADRLPKDYFAQLRKHADDEHRDWLLRRNSLIKQLQLDAAWKLEPFGEDVSLFCDRERSTARSCIAIAPEKRAEIAGKIALMAAEAELIKTMFNGCFCRSARSMWLPIIAPEGLKKLVFSQNDAYCVEPENIVTLHHGYGLSAATLNVDDYLAERGWRRDQVTIRRPSGSRYEARLWAGADLERIQSNCVLVDFADDLGQRVSVREPGAKRVDAQVPAATWHHYEFLYYPAGRPRKPKGRVL